MASRQMHISEVYASQLEDLVLGYPLWFPEGPDNSDEIDVGDVGYIHQGQFVELFKAKYARDHHKNAENLRKGRIPATHVPLPEKAYSHLLTTANYLEPKMYTSNSMAHSELKPSVGAEVPTIAGAQLGYSLSTTEEKAAFLCITHKAINVIVENTRECTKYMKQYHSAWLEHAKYNLGLAVGSRDVVMVQGYVKTVEWTIGASRVGSVSQGGSFQLGGGVNVVGNITLEFTHAVSKRPTMQYRTGPEKRLQQSRSPSPSQKPFDSMMAEPSYSRGASVSEVPIETLLQPIPNQDSLSGLEDPKSDQCIFLRYFQVRWRIPGAYLRIKAGAGPHQLPRNSDAGGDAGSSAVVTDSGSEDEVESNSSSHSAHSWLDTLLDYLLQHSDADVAIACHGDINSLLSNEDAVPDFGDFLEQKKPQIYVDEDKVATLDLVELVVHQRMRKLRRALRSFDADDAMDTDEVDDDDRTDLGQTSGGGVVDGGLLLGDGCPACHSRSIRWPHMCLTRKDPGANSVSAIAMSPDDKLIVAGFVDGTMQLWNSNTGEALSGFDGPQAESICSVAFSLDGNLLVSGDADGILFVRAAKDLLSGVQRGEVLFRLEGHESDISTVAFSPDGKWVASGSVDCSARIWRVSLDAEDPYFPTTESSVHVVDGLSANVMHVLFTQDSKRLIFSEDSVAKIWDVETGEQSAMESHTGTIWCLALSHDGERVITGSEDHTSRIWYSNTGEELVTIAEHVGPVWSVAWSPNDKYVVSGSYDSTVVVCDSYTGETAHRFSEQTAIVSSITWLPFCDLVCIGSADGNVKLRDTSSGAFVAEFQGHTDKVKDLIPTRDGRNVITASDDGSIRIWSVSDAMRLC